MVDIVERIAKNVRLLTPSQQQKVLEFIESFPLDYDDSEITDEEWLSMMANSPALDFLKDERDIYTMNDGKPYKPGL